MIICIRSSQVKFQIERIMRGLQSLTLFAGELWAVAGAYGEKKYTSSKMWVLINPYLEWSHYHTHLKNTN